MANLLLDVQDLGGSWDALDAVSRQRAHERGFARPISAHQAVPPAMRQHDCRILHPHIHVPQHDIHVPQHDTHKNVGEASWTPQERGMTSELVPVLMCFQLDMYLRATVRQGKTWAAGEGAAAGRQKAGGSCSSLPQ